MKANSPLATGFSLTGDDGMMRLSSVLDPKESPTFMAEAAS